MRDPDDFSGVVPPRDDDGPDGPDPRDESGDDEDLPPVTEDEAMAERLRRGAQMPQNDLGNGERFVLHFGEDCLLCPGYGWFRWSGRVWSRDEHEIGVRRLAQNLSGLILREVPFLQRPPIELALLAEAPELRSRAAAIHGIPSDDMTDGLKAELGMIKTKLDMVERNEARFRKRADRHRQHANTTGNSGRIDNALQEGGVRLAVQFDELDAEALELNCDSGILRFHRGRTSDEGDVVEARCELVDHDRDRRCSKIAPVRFDPGATAPLFERFLTRIQPDREMRTFLQRWFGLSMLGVTFDRMAFFYGSGANGKSVLVDLIAGVMGDYSASARIETFTGTNRRGGADATPDLVPLMGARMVRVSEPDEGQRLQEGLIKEMTGGEPINVRPLHKGFITVRPIFKMTMSGNHKPEIRGTDDGIWRRVMLVPFDVQIPEPERDRDLGQKLMAEAPGVLNWLITGACDFLDNGLMPPASVTSATQEYREDSDPIGAFLTSCCVVTGDAVDAMSSKDLVDAFGYYQFERGEGMWRPTTIARQMKEKAGRWRHPRTGAQFTSHKASTMRYIGIRLTDTFAARLRTAPRDHAGRIFGVGEDPDAPHPAFDADQGG